jgi:ribosome recycling factor
MLELLHQQNSMHTLLSESQTQVTSAIEFLHKELSALRTGRATPVLVEDIPVNAYGSRMEIKGLASISVPDSKSLVIDPWDKSLLQNIEKGIRDSGIGLSPVVDGTVLRIIMPAMTEDNRKRMVKMMKEKLEDARVKIRHVREETREKIIAMEKDKEIGEDEKFKMFDELDKLTKEYSDKVGKIGKAKEEEIMTV